MDPDASSPPKPPANRVLGALMIGAGILLVAVSIIILALNLGGSAGIGPARLGAPLGNFGLTFPVLLDSDERLMDLLHISDFPTSILVGRDGLVKMIYR